MLKTELTRLKESLESCQHLSRTLRRQWSLLATSQRTSAALLARQPAAAGPAAAAERLQQLAEPLRQLQHTLDTVSWGGISDPADGHGFTEYPELGGML